MKASTFAFLLALIVVLGAAASSPPGPHRIAGRGFIVRAMR
jgi:hypothetical protein